MARVGWQMMFHDKLKLVTTLAGVFFAVVLSNQQAGTFLGLLDKNTLFVDNTKADVWIAPAQTEQFVAGKRLGAAVLSRARAAPGVAWAEPLVMGVAQVSLSTGGSEDVSLVGTRPPRFAGGPWNLVAGTPEALTQPDTVIFEDSQRENFGGGFNLGSLRELNNRRVRVGGFTWGLTPFAPPYAFSDVDLARELLKVEPDEQSFVLVGAAPGVGPTELARQLQTLLPNQKVMTREEYSACIVRYLLTKSAIGISFGTSTFFGLLVGFVTVALSMFSGVVDNIRQFGTLKALGATTGDLARLLFVQAITFALLGSVLGLSAITRLAEVARSPQLAIILPPWLLGATLVGMVLMCIAASLLSLVRLRKVEPGMVFR